MISNTTKKLAQDFMTVQKALKRAVEEDLKDVRGTLCINNNLQLWVDDEGINGAPVTIEEVLNAIGLPVDIDVERTRLYKYINFTLDGIPAIILVKNEDYVNE